MPSAARPARSRSMPARLSADRRLEMLVIVECRRRSRERGHRHVEGLPHAIQDVREVRMRYGIADAQSREPVGLRERPRDHEVGMPMPAIACRPARRAPRNTRGKPRRGPRSLRAEPRAAAHRVAASSSQVPVGLFGLATNIMRVCGPTAAASAAGSWPSGCAWPAGHAGATRAVAPEACTALGYTANAYCEYTASTPGTRNASASSTRTSFEPLPSVTWPMSTPCRCASRERRPCPLPSG